jgi:hypothetical protein
LNSASKEAITMKRFGSATWSGSLPHGKGAVSTESQAMKNHPYTFFSRYGETPGTNPEALRMRHALPCRSLECSEWRISCRSGWIANRTSSSSGPAEPLATRMHSTKTAAVKHVLRNELDRIEQNVPLRERLRNLQERVTSRGPTGIEADKAFYDALSGR